MPEIRAYDTNIVQLDLNTSSIVKVQTKTKAENNFYGVTQQFTLSGSVLVLRRKYAEIVVEYRTLDEKKELEQRLPTTELEKKLYDLANSPEALALKNKANEVAAKLIGQEGALAKEVGEDLNGFKALGEAFGENLKTTMQALPVLSTSSSLGAAKTSLEKANSDLITGKSTGNGAPNFVVAQGSPKAINELFQGANKIFDAAKPELTTLLKEVSAVAEEIDADKVLNDVATEASTEIKKVTKSFMKDITPQEPFVQAKETTFGNLLATVVGAARSIEQKAFDLPLDGLKEELPDLIDEFKQTNISKNVVNGLYSDPSTKTPLTNVIQKLGGEINNFGTSRQKFDLVDTIEEFQYDVATCKRDITASVIHWTKSFSDQYLTAYDIDVNHKKLQIAKLGDEEVANAKNKGGIMWHYVILKDGSLQRGRPLELETIAESPWPTRTIHIGFVAGYTIPFGEQSAAIFPTSESITAAQWDTFDKIVESLILLKPGIAITGHNTIHQVTACPGFDVQSYVERKYNYYTPYTSEYLERDEPFTIEELASVPAKKIANAQKGFEPSEVVADVLAKRNTNTDKKTGEIKLPTEQEITDAMDEFKTKIKELDTQDIQLKIKEASAQLSEQFSNPRSELNTEIQNLVSKKDSIVSSIEDARKKLVNTGHEFSSKENTWLKK